MRRSFVSAVLAAALALAGCSSTNPATRVVTLDFDYHYFLPTESYSCQLDAENLVVSDSANPQSYATWRAHGVAEGTYRLLVSYALGGPPEPLRPADVYANGARTTEVIGTQRTGGWQAANAAEQFAGLVTIKSDGELMVRIRPEGVTVTDPIPNVRYLRLEQ